MRGLEIRLKEGGGAIFLGHSPLWGGGGAVFLGISPSFERGTNLMGGDKSPVITAWANSSIFLKILSCPPTPKYEFAPQMPPKF